MSIDNYPWLGHVRNQLVEVFQQQGMPRPILVVGEGGRLDYQMLMSVATTLLCQSSNACGECQHCRLFESNTHPDVMVLGNQCSIGVDQIRELKAWAVQKPLLASYQVALILGANHLNTQSVNAMLKLLEEPPKHFIGMLSARSLDRLPPTLLSRLHILHVPRPSLTDLKKAFPEIATLIDSASAIAELDYATLDSLGSCVAR